jgi:hypothetical protein
MMRPLLIAHALMVALHACEAPRGAAPAGSPPTHGHAGQLGGPGTADSLVLAFERMPCFGPCKAYRVELYRSGYALYDGRLNMEKEGRHAARVPQAALRAAVAKARELGFFGMQDKYDSEVTDIPGTWIRVVADGRDKQVLGRVGQPAAFKALAAYLEGEFLPLPWKPLPQEP